MQQIDFSEFFSTKTEANDFLSRLTAITDKIFQTDFHMEQEMSAQFGINKSDRLLAILRENNINTQSRESIKTFLLKMQETINALPILSLTIAFEPREQTLKSLSEWFLINMKKQVVFDFTVDHTIVAGAALTFNGKFSDFTIRPTVERILKTYLSRLTQATAQPHQPTPTQPAHQNVDHIRLGRKLMDQFNQLLRQSGEYGIVYQVSHPIVFIEGLPTVKTQEVILFETGQKAEVFSINRGKIEARSFSHEAITVGTKVTKTGQLLSIPVGDELLGHTIDPLGDPLDPAAEFIKPKEFRTLDANPVGIAGRAKLETPMITGTTLIDLMIPLGRGQRELVIGDRKTGKTSFVLTAIKSQVHEGIICIYAAIAKKKSDIKRLQEFFVQEKIMDKIIIVATSSYSSPSIIYQTPYAAMAIAEYYKERGQHTLIVFDDLSTHAKFYRELSLLARRFPGRDSYPGDIFYIHSKLLERAGMFKHPTKGSVAISCFPIMEIVEGDLTGYVSTNVMGITDGHIYFDSNIYFQGKRPAVNIPLSVTRVGRQTSDKLTRDVNKNLTIFLSKYEKLLNLSHFGQELTEDTKKDLRTGDLINEFFKQPYQLTIPLTVQLLILSMILQGFIDSKDGLEQAKKNLIKAFHDEQPKKFLMDLAIVNDLKAFNERVLKNKDKLLEIIGMPPAPQPNPQPTPPPPPQTPQQTPPAGPQQTAPSQPAQQQQTTKPAEGENNQANK